MALTTCPECNKAMSSDARECPHCGWRRPIRIGLGWVLLIVLGIICVVGYLIARDINRDTQRIADRQRDAALGPRR